MYQKPIVEMDTSANNPSSRSSLNIPPGYSIREGPDGIHYVLPDFLIPATDVALASTQNKINLNVKQAAGGPLSMQDLTHSKASPASGIKLPPLPSPTERELLNAHAEIIALQTKYGLSYKDASHRLYHSEVAKLMQMEEVHQAISDICRTLEEECISDIKQKIAEIDIRVLKSSGKA
ncbi:hypothetical protein F5887DRAFT_1078251 [Amanita rubescens]|nr:hypothetical protein F5887DRAFT_1078251 [Amanita rubescens]